MRRVGACLSLVLVAGCAGSGKSPAPMPAQEIPAAQETERVVESPKLANATLKYLAGRNLKPLENRPISVKSRCSHRDAIGTATRLDVLVKESEVRNFSAQVSMKGHGTCRFDLADFEQVQRMPQPLLRHKHEADCQVRMWEQDRRMTIAFNSCPKSCEGDAFDYLWPIMVEEKSGRCF